MDEMVEVWMHLTYLALSVVTTVWVARKLFKHGAPFLIDAFHGDERMAEAVNQLLVVGFYLINVGWIARTLNRDGTQLSAAQAIVYGAEKYGTVLLVLGVMHFANIYVFTRIRRSAQLDRSPPPVSPTHHLETGYLGG